MNRASRLIWILGTLVILVATIALRNAVVSYGRPVPGVLIDVGGSVSSIGLPDWDGRHLGLHFPQLLLPADAPREGGSRARTGAWDRAVAQATEGGTIQAVLQEGEDERVIELRVRTLEPLAWWVYGGLPLIAGLFYAGAGLIALWASPRGRLARTFATFGVNYGLFLLAFFDVHTIRSLAPIFFVSFALLPWTLVMLILRLPDDVWILRRFPRVEQAGVALSLGVGALASIVYESGGSTLVFQILFTWMLVAAGLIFTIGFGIRFARAQEERRRALLPLLISMVPPYLVGAIGLLLGTVVGGATKGAMDVLSWPAMTLAPLASVYAFVRYDLWGSRALLSRIGTHVVLGAIACVSAIAGAAALAGSVGLSFRDAIAGASVSTLLAVTLTAIARRVSDSTLFRSRADYKPTIEQLSSELLTIASPADVARAIERTVERWLPCEQVHLTLDQAAAFNGPVDPAADGQTDPHTELRLPVTFGGRALAWLEVGSKRGGALFTRDDVDLLNTIANQGALAIAHAHAYQELEHRRKQQAHAWRGEREALVETVAAEIAHEIRYPINYFRSVFERSAQGEPLDSEDVDVGREEVERLERLVSGLRRMAAHRLERTPLPISELAVRAEALLRDSLGPRTIDTTNCTDAVIRCDPDKMLQVIVNLLSNALEAAGPDGSVGVSWQEAGSGAELIVWDDGPGFVGDPARLFAPWYTTKPRGTGLGLAITHRLVRAHGWNVTAQRRGERTVFVVTVRKEDVVQSGGRFPHAAVAEAEVA